MHYAYPCTMVPYPEDGVFVTSFPDVPGALTDGRDMEEVTRMAEDALSVMLSGYVKMGWDIPTPSAPEPGQVMIAVYPIVAAKLALYTLMRERRITKVALGEMLGISEAAVRKLVNPDHRSHISQVERALKLLGYSLALSVAPVGGEAAPASPSSKRRTGKGVPTPA
ncbi:MAG: type II toxin-antitoxin system HicB family antitoxin [Chloroflexota bacterium]|nr:type II toxin-antitoxin system HicB family antitoxin [Chloroflexota bacterium]